MIHFSAPTPLVLDNIVQTALSCTQAPVDSLKAALPYTQAPLDSLQTALPSTEALAKNR